LRRPLRPYDARMATITGSDIQDMVRHWLNTPVDGYLGSDYGQDLKALLQLPQSDGAPDALLQKLRDDVPVLQALPRGSVNLYGVQSPPDRLDLAIEVAGRMIEVRAITPTKTQFINRGAPTRWDEGSTIWDGGVTVWD